MKKKLTYLLILLGFASLAFTTGCETTEGFGQDVENLGEEMD